MDTQQLIDALAQGGGLEVLLAALINGGMAGYIVFRFLDAPAGQKLREAAVRWLAPLGVSEPEAVRYLAMELSAMISLLAYAVAVLVGIEPMPPNVITVVGYILQWGAMTFAGSQKYHAPHIKKQPPA